jgi:membrane protease YdiL (CAAX protease family)
MSDNAQQDPPQPIYRPGRLQRGPSLKGYRVATFSDVLKRHGFTMGSLAAICLTIPITLPVIVTTTTRFFQQPVSYLASVLVLLVFFSYWSTRRSVATKLQAQWIFYLLFISIVEELTFRLIFPLLLAPQFNWLTANILSNVVFASIHYVTLRWKLRHCIFTFLGGMGLSQLMSHGDLAIVVLVHWLGTFINTPFPPTVAKD